MKITTDLSDDQIAVLVRALDWPPSKTPEELAQAWQQLAVEAWLSWLSGEKRYNSLTEQYTDWIEKIYEHLLPETEAPSVERLWDKFHVPYGQAQYIARVLNNRQMARWREHEREGLKTAMSKRKDEAYRWIEQGDEMEHVEMKLLKPAMKELYIIIEGTVSRIAGGREGDADQIRLARQLGCNQNHCASLQEGLGAISH